MPVRFCDRERWPIAFKTRHMTAVNSAIGQCDDFEDLLAYVIRHPRERFEGIGHAILRDTSERCFLIRLRATRGVPVTRCPICDT